MNDIIGENHKKISIGRTTQQLLKDLKDRGQGISKSHLLQITNDLELREEGSVTVQSIWTVTGARNTNLYSKEAVRKIILSVDKIIPQEKKQYLIESTKPKSMSLTEIKQFGLALIGLSETMENQQKQIEDLKTEQNMCRVSAEKDEQLKKFQREIVEHRLHKKKLVWNDDSARQKEFQYLRGYLGKEFGISRVTNLNAKEYEIIRNELLEIMEREKIPY